MLYLVYHLKSIRSDVTGKRNTESCLSNMHVSIHLMLDLKILIFFVISSKEVL